MLGGCPGLVVKADGLAAGKGVAVCRRQQEAISAVEACFKGFYGEAGNTVLIEEMLVGEEVSVLALTDSKTIIPLVSSQDHKRVGEGDTGPNTGGMGAYSPAPIYDVKLEQEVNEKILGRFLAGVKADGLDFRGLIYAGIMITPSGPKVLEFNVRFGDPETQAILVRLESDLLDAMVKTVEGRLDEARLKWTYDPSVCVVMAAGGYPGSYGKGYPISGLAEAAAEGAEIFHAGTALKEGKIVSSGGRVLGVTAKGADIKAAVDNAYRAVSKISWSGSFYRKDIAHRALARMKK